MQNYDYSGLGRTVPKHLLDSLGNEAQLGRHADDLIGLPENAPRLRTIEIGNHTLLERAAFLAKQKVAGLFSHLDETVTTAMCSIRLCISCV